jgi:putative transposase
LVHELSCDFPVAVACRVLNISTSGYYEWRSRRPSEGDLDDAHLIDQIRVLHAAARGTYGVRRVHAELVLGRRLRIGHGRIERLMRLAGLQGVHHRKWRYSGSGRLPAVFEDRVKRVFSADAPDKLWVMDITQHRTSEGWVYCAAVIDVFSRRCVGWSIADHLRTELVVDAIEMARWRGGGENLSAPSSIPTAEPNIEPFVTPTVSPTPRQSPRSGPKETATITPSPRRSTPSSKPN